MYVLQDISISWSVVNLLWMLRKRYLKTGVPITWVLDNARYQRCYLVSGAAKLMGIELLFLPPYSPNLNLIERYWKFVKKNVLAAKEYSTFNDFCQSSESSVQASHITHEDQLRSLLVWNFQALPEVSIIAA